MPTREEVLASLTSIANQYSNISIAWHIIIVILFITLFVGWKPANGLMILLLSSLFMSVSGFAAIEGNFFNAMVFAFLVILSIYAALRSPNEPIKGDRSWPDIVGLFLIVFGLLYPEFFITGSFLEYAYAAPTGLIPCPTLAVVTGFTLLYRGFGSITWTVCIALSGMFYGLFGIFYLGIYLDLFLVAGAIMLLRTVLFLTIRTSLK